MKFFTQFTRPINVTTVPDTETVYVQQSEAERASLKYQLERFGMDTLLSKLKQAQSQFGYADTRFSKSFGDLAQAYADASQYFSILPAQIRAEFGHDPIKFYELIEKNPKQAFDRGFISKDLAKSFGVYKDDISSAVTTSVVDKVETVEQQPSIDEKVSA